MKLEEIGTYLEGNINLLAGVVPGSLSGQVRKNLVLLRDRLAGEGIEVEVEADEPPVSVDDGFAILSMPRYEALRQAEEHLQETRFAPTNGESDDKQATIDALKRRVDELSVANGLWRDNFQAREAHIIAQALEIGRLKADLEQSYRDRGADLEERNSVAEGWRRHCEEIRTAAAPLDPEAPRAADEVLLKHIRDHQAEIEGIKDRTDRTDMTATRTYNDIYNRLDDRDRAVDEKLSTIFDRLGVMTSRLNKIDAREVAKT